MAILDLEYVLHFISETCLLHTIFKLLLVLII